MYQTSLNGIVGIPIYKKSYSGTISDQRIVLTSDWVPSYSTSRFWNISTATEPATYKPAIESITNL